MASTLAQPYRGLPPELRLQIWEYIIPKQVHCSYKFRDRPTLLPSPLTELVTEPAIDISLLLLSHEISEECLPLYQAIEISYHGGTGPDETLRFGIFFRRALLRESFVRHVTFRDCELTTRLLTPRTILPAIQRLRLLRVENRLLLCGSSRDVVMSNYGCRFNTIGEVCGWIHGSALQFIAHKVEIEIGHVTPAAKGLLTIGIIERRSGESTRITGSFASYEISIKWHDHAHDCGYSGLPRCVGSGLIEIGGCKYDKKRAGILLANIQQT